MPTLLVTPSLAETAPAKSDEAVQARIGRGFVEDDGVSVLLARPVQPCTTLEARRQALRAVTEQVVDGLSIPFSSERDVYPILVEIERDIVVRLPQTPPVITETLEQAAVDAILSLGQSPATRHIDRAMRDFAHLSDVNGEMRELAAKQAAGGYVSRRVTLNDINVALRGKYAPGERAAALLAILPAGELQPITRSVNRTVGTPPMSASLTGPVESNQITGLVTMLASDLAAFFAEKTVELNGLVQDAFLAQVEETRSTVPARYRSAYDRAAATLRDAADERRLFLPPRLYMAGGNLALSIRPHMLAQIVRYGGYQCRMDVDVHHGDLDPLLKRRERPLWLRIYDPGKLQSWQRRNLARYGLARDDD